MRTVSIADISKETLQGLGAAYKKILDDEYSGLPDTIVRAFGNRYSGK